MNSPDSRMPAGHSKKTNGWTERIFILVEKFACNHPVQVVLVAVLLAGASLWYAVNHLTFQMQRSELVSQSLPFVQINKKYSEEFVDFDGMLVVIEGKDHGQMKGFADALVGKLRERKAMFVEIFYKVDPAYFKDKGLLYLDFNELRELGEKIRAHREFLDKVNANPGLNRLLVDINAEIGSGMVSALVSGLLGDDANNDEEKSDAADMNLLKSILRQMAASLDGDTLYQSPWQSFLSDRKDSLAESGYLVSDDEKMMFILVNSRETDGDFEGGKGSIEVVRDLIRELKLQFPDVDVGVTGDDVISADEMATTQADVTKASYLALTGVSLALIFTFKGILKPLLAVFVLMIGLSWALGFATLTVGHLNILSVAFTTVLMGLGIDFGIHIIERYREARRVGDDIGAALQKTIHGTGRGCFAGAVTTSIAFGAVTLTDFRGIAEWGWIAGSGTILCFIGMLTVLPALIALEERFFQNKYAPFASAMNGEKSLADRFFDHYKWIISISAILVVVALFSFSRVGFDYNLLHLQAKGTEAVKYELKVIEHAKRSTWYAAVIAASLDDARQKLKLIEALPTVGKVESIVSVLPDRQEEKITYLQTLAPLLDGLNARAEVEPVAFDALVGIMKRIGFKLQGRGDAEDKADPLMVSVAETRGYAQKILQNMEKSERSLAEKRLNDFSEKLFADYREKLRDLKLSAHPQPVRIEGLPPELRKRFIGRTDKYLLSVYPNVNVWDREAMAKFLSELRGIDPLVTGDAVYMFESSRLMREGYIKGGIYATSAIVIYVFILFKNLRTSLLVLLPKFVGAIWTVGLMDLLDVQFNLANLVILPLILGIGISNGIHIMHRFHEESDKTVSVLGRSTGQAVALSSFTTILGFGTLVIADHQGIHSLGLVLALGMGACLVASLTLLPALLKLCVEKGWKV